MKRALLSAVTLVLIACGGNVVVDPQGAGGQGATTTGAGATSTVVDCPTAMPQACDSETTCPCADGTTQIGGCPNGFTCPEACCGHGGSE